MHGQEKKVTFLKSLNEFDTYIKLTFEFNKESSAFFDIKVSLKVYYCRFENLPVSAKIFVFI